MYQLFEYVGTSTSGQIAIPEEAQIFDVYGDGILDAIMVEADQNNNPTETNSVNSSGEIVQVTSLNNDGDYVLDSIPTKTACILYYIKIKEQYKSNVPEDSIVTPGIQLNKSPYGTITVAKSNADFTSIKEACGYVATQVSISKPFVIEATGAFIEEPITIPNYTKINLKGGSIVPSDQNNPLITMSGQYSEFRGGNVVCPTNSDGILVTAGNTAIKDVVLVNAGGCIVKAQDLGLSRLLMRNVTVSNATKGICIDNSFVILTTASSTGATDASIEITNGSNVIIDSFVSALSNVDLRVLDNDSVVRMNASQVDIDKLEIENWENVFLSFNSPKEGDEALENAQELHVGVPEKGREFVAGEGDSYTRGMLVFTETSGGVFADVSEEARSASGSTFTFPDVSANNAIYIASTLKTETDFLKHAGIKTLVDLAATNGGGEIVVEYWNGVDWVEVNAMEADSSDRYFPHAKNYFQDTGGHHIRYNRDMSIDSWTKNDPISPALGTSYYWSRYRISTDISIAPIFQQFKLHTNRFESNSDGWNEYFGKARPTKQLPFAIGQDKALAGNLSNQSLWINEDIGSGLNENSFNSVGDIIGRTFFLPQDLDTSSPIKFKLVGRPSGTGTAEFTVRWDGITENDIIYTSNPALSTGARSQAISKTTVTGQSVFYDFLLDVSNFVSRRENGQPDVLSLTIETTILTGTSISIFAIEAEYAGWCEGGHI